MTTRARTTAEADALIDPRHPFAAHLRRYAELEATAPSRQWTPEDGALPSIYLGHGAPMLFEDALWMDQLLGWARSMPKPTSVLVVSAHWEEASLSLSASKPAELEYDFSGFGEMYHHMRYDTPDASDLARQVRAMLPDTEQVHEHHSRGLDHGAWVPLKVMYPDGDVPVLQMSLPTYDTTRLLALGERLRELREQGVLVIGSGYLTHGIPYIDWKRPDHVPGWSSEFDMWAEDALSHGDLEELAHFRTRGPGMPYAHPTVEHFAPLFITLGAAADPTAPVTTAIDGFSLGLSKRSFQAA